MSSLLVRPARKELMTAKKKSTRSRSKTPRAERARPASTFAFLDDFARALESQDRSPATIHGYRNSAKQFAQWLSQTRGESYATMQAFVRAITPTDVRAYRAYLLNVQHTPPGTINHRLTTLHVLVRWARHAGLIEGDPVNCIKRCSRSSSPRAGSTAKSNTPCAAPRKKTATPATSRSCSCS